MSCLANSIEGVRRKLMSDAEKISSQIYPKPRQTIKTTGSYQCCCIFHLMEDVRAMAKGRTHIVTLSKTLIEHLANSLQQFKVYHFR